jgi:hypothetical protein
MEEFSVAPNDKSQGRRDRAWLAATHCVSGTLLRSLKVQRKSSRVVLHLFERQADTIERNERHSERLGAVV